MVYSLLQSLHFLIILFTYCCSLCERYLGPQLVKKIYFTIYAKNKIFLWTSKSLWCEKIILDMSEAMFVHVLLFKCALLCYRLKCNQHTYLPKMKQVHRLVSVIPGRPTLFYIKISNSLCCSSSPLSIHISCKRNLKNYISHEKLSL